jgi:uncharacterized RDD family membrane protein YckC
MSPPPRAEYAGPVSRAVAFGLDAALVSALAVGVAASLQLVVTVLGSDLRELVRAATPVLLMTLPAVLVGYDAVFWSLTGRTPGMAVLGVRVTTAAGGRVPWHAALIRAVVLGYFPVGALWCLVDRRCQAIHDKLARTVVVRA